MEKKNKLIAPNEASLIRWIACVFAGIGIGTAISLPVEILIAAKPAFMTQGVIGYMYDAIKLFNNFVGLFIGAVIALRVVAKTTLREFIYGVGGKGNKKQNIIVLGLYMVGLLLAALTSIGNVRLGEFPTKKYFFCLIIVVLFTWMQTSWEELIFRGVFIRYACKNNITCSKKAVLCGVISSLIFMSIHFANPEILAQDGLQVVLTGFAYFATGISLYFVDIYFKSLMPGLIIHWINNFVNFSLYTGVVSAGGLPTIFVDHTEATGVYYLLGLILAYAPVYVYILIDIIRKRRVAKA